MVQLGCPPAPYTMDVKTQNRVAPGVKTGYRSAATMAASGHWQSRDLSEAF
jgi:hypothetical protein